ncbi:MAG: CmpA/NrtA family ABC transporter substrate-binding protein [Thermodesulfovibrionales bacterium]
MNKHRNRLSRREFLKTSSLAAAAACLSSVPWAGRVFAASSTTLRIGVIAPSHCALPLVHASLTNAYKKNDVKAEIVYLPDTLDIAKGLNRGELHAGQIISPVFFSMVAGSGPFKGNQTSLVTAQVGGTNGGVLVVGANSGITLPTELAGKSIGVHSPLMVHSLLINMLLKRHGIDPVSGVTRKTITMGKLIPALKSNEIDAFINPEPLGTVAISGGAGKELVLTKNLWFRHPCCLVAVRENFYREEPETVKSFYLSSLESGLILNNVSTRNEALKRIHMDAKPYNAISASAMQKAFTPGRTDFDPFPYQSSGKAVLRMMKESNLLPASVDIDQMTSKTILSDLSRQLLKKLGDNPPPTNNRQEKIVGEIMA